MTTIPKVFRRLPLIGSAVARLSVLGVLSVAPSDEPTHAPKTNARTPRSSILEPIRSAKGISEYHLRNGLLVLIRPDNSSAAITLTMRYQVGRFDEREGQHGLAHLMEHLAFTGTPRHPNLRREISAHGADVGATTTEELTTFAVTIPSTTSDLRWALDVEADRMIHLEPSSVHLEAQRAVISNEIGNGAPRLLQRLRAITFDDDPYSGNGANADLRRLTLDDVRAFYRTYFAPNNAVLSIDGSVDEATAIQLAERAFSSLHRRSLPKPRTVRPAPQSGERAITVRGPDGARVLVAHRIPSISSSRFAAATMALRALTAPGKGRIWVPLVQTGLASSVSLAMRVSRYPDIATIAVSPSAASATDSVVAVLRRVLDELPARPLSDAEIDAARPATVRRAFTAAGASECALAGDWRFCVIEDERLRATNAAEVREAAAAYLVPSRRSLAVSLPELRPPTNVLPVSGFEDPARFLPPARDTTNLGERFDPSMENIGRRLVGKTLSSGIELRLLPKRNADRSITGRLALTFGDSVSLIGQATAGELVSRLLFAGTMRRSADSIAADLRRLGADVRVASTPRPSLATLDDFIDLTDRAIPWRGIGLDVRFHARRSTFPSFLALLIELLREPAFDSARFEALRRHQVELVQQRLGWPNADLVYAGAVPGPDTLHPEHVLSLRARERALQEIRLSDLRNFHDRFYGAAAGVLAIVGDFSVDTISSQLDSIFREWRNDPPVKPVTIQVVRRAARDTVLSPAAGSNAGGVYLGAHLPVLPSSSDFAALLIANSILGGSVDSRLFSAIRERMGLSYSIGSRIQPRVDGASVLWTIEASYDVNLADSVRHAIEAQLAAVAAHGFTAVEVQTAKANYLARQRLRRATDDGLAEVLSASAFLELDSLEKRVARLTTEAVNAAARRFFDPSLLTVVQIGGARAP